MMPIEKHVVIGVSGGVDSAVATYLLQKEGYRVTAVFFLLFNQPKSFLQKIKKIGNVLGQEIEVVDLRSDFRDQVIRPFIKMHYEGQTPSPCTICNKTIKWHFLKQIANKVGAQYFATGHYVGTENYQSHTYIVKGSDESKDQSYYLWDIPADIIERMVLPLQGYSKISVKQLAEELGLGFLANQKESSGVCFMQHLPFEHLYESYYPGHLAELKEGLVEDSEGKKIGTHHGYPLYTIGQQKNIQHSLPGKWAVKQIQATKNKLVLDKPKNLVAYSFIIHQVNFIDEKLLVTDRRLTVKVRGLGLNPEGVARVSHVGDGNYHVELTHPAWAPCPGQPAVFYKDHRLLGGGLISDVFFQK